MQYTDRLGLRKPQRGANADPANIEDLNYNFDKLDEYTEKLINITYDELKELRDNSQLVPGQQYRITDYETIINGNVTNNGETKTLYRSAGHQFDIIVVADDVNILNENARAAVHAKDTYFANCDLNAWKLKYCIDNDVNRFGWATNSGKGVIWFLEDEFNNLFPFDFKNIQMKRHKVLTDDDGICVGTYVGNYDYDLSICPKNTTFDENDFVWTYTLSNVENNSDLSITGRASGNRMNISANKSDLMKLNNIVYSSRRIQDCILGTQISSSITFVSSVNIQDIYSYGSLIGAVAIAKSEYTNLRYIRFNGFNYYYKLGAGCSQLSFGNSCNNIKLGDNCSNVSFGNGCGYISLGDNCSNVSFGNGCYSNSFSTITNSHFGNLCIGNDFTAPSSVDDINFGNRCYTNICTNNGVSFYALTLEENANNLTFNRGSVQGNIYITNSVNHCQIGASGISILKTNKNHVNYTSANDGQVITS